MERKTRSEAVKSLLEEADLLLGSDDDDEDDQGDEPYVMVESGATLKQTALLHPVLTHLYTNALALHTTVAFVRTLSVETYIKPGAKEAVML